MEKLNKMYTRIKKMIEQNKRSFIVYISIYTIISILYTVLIVFSFPKYSKNIILLICIFVGIVILSILTYINQIYFQRNISITNSIRKDFTSIKIIFFHSLRIYFLQFIISIGITFGFGVLILIPLFFLKEYGSLIMPIISFSIIIFIYIWILRLQFLNYILVYKREHYKMKEIIIECKNILKKNLFIVLSLIIIQIVLVTTPRLFFNQFINSISYLFLVSFFSMMYNFIITIVLIYIVIDELNKSDIII